MIRDPKTRLISAPHFRDRVIHHALCNIIEPIFDSMFIHDSYASRKGKGTHAALRRLDCFKRKISCNGRRINGWKDNNVIIGYALKCDIRHYFASVDHAILLEIIRNKISDQNVLWLIAKILHNGSGKGMPIGALTSQLFANIYLNELDYFVKHELGVKCYIRYMDDFVILHREKEELVRIKSEIADFVLVLKIELHSEKSRIFPLHRGICFLGYRIFYKHKLLKKGASKLLECKLKHIDEERKATESFDGWLAYAIHANSYNMRKRIASRFNLAFNPRLTTSRAIPQYPRPADAAIPQASGHAQISLSGISFCRAGT